MLNKNYHQRLLDIAQGKPINDTFFILSDESKVRYNQVQNLAISDGDVGTPQFNYQMICDRGSDMGIICIGDPYHCVDSVALAESTQTVIEDKNRLINIIDNISLLANFSFWDPHLQKQFGSLEEDVLYIVAGFEHLDEETLLRLFHFPEFEVGLEHYQEHRGSWNGVNYSHRFLLLLTGVAEEAFQTAGIKHTVEGIRQAEQLGYGGPTSVGSMNNLLDRIAFAQFYCVND